MYVSQDEVVDPLTREMFRAHHVDEARHIAFARWVGESFFEQAAEEDAAKMRGLMRGLMARLIPQFTYNPEIAVHASFDFPVAADDLELITQIGILQQIWQKTKSVSRRFIAGSVSWKSCNGPASVGCDLCRSGHY